MESRTKGAWILHHANKLSEIQNHEFEEIDLAGKAGKLLSGLVASHEESKLNKEKVQVIAKVAGVNKAELPTLLNHLKTEHLIEESKSGEVVALGITTTSILSHTANVFDSLNPSKSQKAALTLSEEISSKPVSERTIKELISDTHKLSSTQVGDLIQQAEEIGFLDSETIDNNKILFNGNLFKSDSIKKATKIFETLNTTESRALAEIDEEVGKNGVITFEKAERIAGRSLLEKVQSIGLFEFSRVSNSHDTKLFITKPGAFSKYGNPFEEDALDLAKSFVASLSYGINYSASTRGRIDMLYALLNALIKGRTVGPATAIGQDYKYLEIKRVVEIIPNGNKYYMRLLKKEVGELALQVMKQGDVSESTLLSTTSNISGFDGPERTRQETRRKKRRIKQSDAEVANLLRTLRS